MTETLPLKPSRRRYSPKRRALAKALGDDWEKAVMGCVRRQMSLEEMARDWTAQTGEEIDRWAVRRIIDYVQEQHRQRQEAPA